MSNIKVGRRFASAGFTLIEIMVVVVILGILAGIVVPKIMDNPEKARIVKAQNDIRAIETALNMYRLEKFNYPTTDQGLEALVNPPDTGTGLPGSGYMTKIPLDPWGRPYQYLSPGSQGEVDVFSFGRDGRPGGDSFDKDIGNWELN